ESSPRGLGVPGDRPPDRADRSQARAQAQARAPGRARRPQKGRSRCRFRCRPPKSRRPLPTSTACLLIGRSKTTIRQPWSETSPRRATTARLSAPSKWKGSGARHSPLNENVFLDYGTHPSLNFRAGGDFTFACWMKSTSKSGMLISQRHSKDDGPEIDFFFVD